MAGIRLSKAKLLQGTQRSYLLTTARRRIHMTLDAGADSGRPAGPSFERIIRGLQRLPAIQESLHLRSKRRAYMMGIE